MLTHLAPCSSVSQLLLSPQGFKKYLKIQYPHSPADRRDSALQAFLKHPTSTGVGWQQALVLRQAAIMANLGD